VANCRKCGRPLKDPNSITLGFGKVCAAQMNMNTTPLSSSRRTRKRKKETGQHGINAIEFIGLCNNEATKKAADVGERE